MRGEKMAPIKFRDIPPEYRFPMSLRLAYLRGYQSGLTEEHRRVVRDLKTDKEALAHNRGFYDGRKERAAKDGRNVT